MNWSGWLCLHLDERGRPCNRATMKASISDRYCAAHRPEAELKRQPRRGPSPEYQRARRARIAQAGLSPAMEAA
jgi:hypothetical protein